MSYTAKFTKNHGIKILDENDSVISSFSHIATEGDYIRPNIPILIVDKFADKKIIIDLNETEPIINYSDLQRMGYVIISQRVNPSQAWFKNQRVFFRLCSKENIPRNCSVYTSIPRHLFVRYDYVNKLIRLEDKDRGKRRKKDYSTSPQGYGDWYEVKEIKC